VAVVEGAVTAAAIVAGGNRLTGAKTHATNEGGPVNWLAFVFYMLPTADRSRRSKPR
jgi:hypothetical protein